LCVRRWAVLHEKFEDAVTIMEKVIATKDLSEIEFLQWPLFKEFRESDLFAPAYTKYFGKEPFETIETINADSNK